MIAVTLISGGCSSKSSVHPIFSVETADIDLAAQRGKDLINRGAKPEDAYYYQAADINQRISSDVIVRTAGMVMPVQRIAYEIAKSGDTSDAGLRSSIAEGLKAAENELMCFAEIQIPMTMDPAGITFKLKTNTGTTYPPIAVETPIMLREFKPAYDLTASNAAVYYYVIRFPVRGGPGVPPIGPSVMSLTMTMSDGSGQVSYTCDLPKKYK